MHRPYADKSLAPAARSAARRIVLGELVALGLLVAMCAALAALGGLIRPAVGLGIAAERLSGPAFSSGIYARELAPDGSAYRWTSGAALIQLRGAANAAPAYLAELRLRAEHPAGPQPLTFAAHGTTLATITPGLAFRTYRLLLPAGADELSLGLTTPTFVAPGNPRPLGVILADAALRPWPRPDLPAAAPLALGLVLLYILQRGLGLGARQALALAGLTGLGLAALAALYRPAPLPYPALAGLALAGIGGAAWLARPFAARLALAALLLVVAASGLIWPAWLSDDAFISFRYAQNLAQGHGLVYNIGERVEGYTNFLWTLLFAGVIALGGDVALWSHLLGVGLGLAIVLLTYAQAVWAQGSATPRSAAAWAVVAALICGSSQSLLLYTARGSGLETGLFTLLVLAGGMAYLAARARPAGLACAGALFALAALTRPEGLLVGGLTGLHLAATLWFAGADGGERTEDGQAGALSTPGLRTARLASIILRPASLLAFGGAFLAIFLPYFLWRLSYYGDLLPNTFYAKTGGGARQVARGLAYAGGFALTLGGPLLLAIGVPWRRDWRAALASWRGYILPLVAVYSAYIVAVGGDHFRGERFFVPLLPWLAILLADGLRALSQGLGAPTPARAIRGQRGWAARAPILLALALGVGSLGALARTTPIDQTIRGLDESVWIWRELGWWLADNASPGESVAASGAGAIAYYSQLTTVDLLGLTDKHIGRLAVDDMGAGVAGHEKRDPVYVLEIRRPTYIPQIWDDYFGGPNTLRSSYTLTPIRSRSGRELQMWVRNTRP